MANLWLCWGMAGAASLAAADRPVSFSRDIQPIFAATCWTCHGASVQLSKLDLRSRDAALRPGGRQFLYSSNSNDTGNLDNGEIYKMELDGKIVGRFGRAGKLMKEFGTVNSLDCRNPNELLVGELTNWRVQKLTLH